ncbi:unnamed protein product [Chrysoparadoxa australica]
MALTKDSPDFRVLVRALKDSMDAELGGLPPLPGEIPDMTAETDSFILLQQVYQAKAEKDFQVIAERTASLLESVGRPADSISVDDMRLFCKNCCSLLSVTTRTIAQETEQLEKEAIFEAMEDPYEVQEQTPMLWYLALRGADLFFQQHQRYPGTTDATLQADGAALWDLMKGVMKQAGLEEGGNLTEQHAKEIARYGACELHNIAAIVGGIAAQEAVKVITHQYTPLNNTVIYNGVAGVAAVYEL